MKDYAAELFQTMTYLERGPSLEALQQRFPEHWRIAEGELAAAIRDKDKARLDQLMRPLEGLPKKRQRQQPVSKQESRDLQGRLIRQRMCAIAIERYLKGSLVDPRRTLGTLDRLLLRLIFFKSNWRRKLVRPFLFHLLWPRVRRKNLLMPLAEAHGIYNFFSIDLVRGISSSIGKTKCVEIAAGDGYLTKALAGEGADIRATDDRSWQEKGITFGDVETLGPAEAIAYYRPETVLCSWPPARNDFERHVFAAPHVQRYIVIASDHRNLAGNWPLYLAQQEFKMEKSADLSRHLYPPEAHGAVYIFDRIQVS